MPEPLDRTVAVLRQSLLMRRKQREEREAMLAQGLAELARRAQQDNRLAAEMEHAQTALSVVHGAEIDQIRQQELAAEASLVKLTAAAEALAAKLQRGQLRGLSSDELSTVLHRCGISHLSPPDFRDLLGADLGLLTDEELQALCPVRMERGAMVVEEWSTDSSPL